MIAVMACAGAGPRGESPQRDALDAGIAPALEAARMPAASTGPSRGDACPAGAACAAGLTCLPGAAGYCTSRCDTTDARCEGACVDLPDGPYCMKSCDSDAQCRIGEGYVCDPTWHACLWPSTTAIAVPTCPAPVKARDPAFAPTQALSTPALPGSSQHSPSAVVTDTGELVAVYASRGAPTAGLGLARVDRAGVAEVDQTFVPAAGTAATDPMLARGPGTHVYAVWRVGAEVHFAVSKNRGVTWGAAIAVSTAEECAEAAACTGAPVLAAGRGAAHVLYDAGPGGLRVRTSRDGGRSFGAARTIATGTLAAATVSPDGRLHVVALVGSMRGAYGSANQRLEYVVAGTGDARDARPIMVSLRDEKLPFVGARPAIVVDGSRKQLFVAYVRGGRDGAWDLVVAAAKLPTSGAPTSWRRARIGDAPACAMHTLPTAALDPRTGRLQLAWIDSRGGGRVARATCALGTRALGCTEQGRLDDTAFGALTTMVDADRSLGTRAALVVDDTRRAIHAVWTQPTREGPHGETRIRHARGTLPKR